MEMLLKSDADRTRGFTQEEINEIQRALDEQKLSDPRPNRFLKSLPEDEEMLDDPRPNRFFKSLPEDRPKNLKDFVEEVFKKDSSFTRDPFADATEEEKEEAEAELKKQRAKKAGGGSVEKEADFVKDDDEEPADPPPGATPEEVADDIPAYLSTGEYVLPANVVRYLGLERIVSMHKGALSALQQMEDLDIIENVDENGMVEEDDDEMDYLKEPKGVVKTTLVVAKPHPSGMMAMPFAEGGEADAVDEMDPENDLGQSAAEMGDVGAFGGPDSPAEAGGVPADPGQDDDPGEDLMDFSTPMTMDDLDQMSKDAPSEGLAGLFKSAFNKVKDKLEEDPNVMIPGYVFANIATDVLQDIFGPADKDQQPAPSDELDNPDLGIGGGEDSGIITEEKLEGDEDKNQEEADFVFQPGVGFIPKRRGIRRVQALRETDLPTARRGGLMGY